MTANTARARAATVRSAKVRTWRPVPGGGWPATRPGRVTPVPPEHASQRLLHPSVHPDTLSTRADGSFVHVNVCPAGALCNVVVAEYPAAVREYGWPLMTTLASSRHVFAVPTSQLEGDRAELPDLAAAVIDLRQDDLAALRLMLNWGRVPLADATAALTQLRQCPDAAPLRVEQDVQMLVRLYASSGLPLLRAAIRSIGAADPASRTAALRAFTTALGDPSPNAATGQ